MLHSIKRFWAALMLLLCGGGSVFAYSYLGPLNSEAFQVSTIGYQLPGDIGTPKNFGQGYRWNTPTNYYAYDEEFENRYFGSNGVAAVDSAFAMFNNLSNVTQLNLNDYPLKASRVNYAAQQLGLIDLKSYTMSMLIEQLGLAEPDRWTWCLHDRYLPPGAQCPNYIYLIIMRNFDPYTGLYSPYVNGVFYDYQIEEFCPASVVPQADAFEVVVDPLQAVDRYSAVAAYGSEVPGTFFTGFTRDDIGGLKALYAATNVYAESAESNSFELVTNGQTLLVTSNLAIFEAQSLTNNAAALEALYPGLVVLTETNIFTNVVTTNVTAFLTNPPYAAAGTVQLVLVTNYTTNVQTLFLHTFANVEIVHTFPQSYVSQQTVTFGPKPYGAVGIFYTNTVTTTSSVNIPNGDFYILTSNLCAPYQIVRTQLVTVTPITNNIPIPTNVALVTNLTTTLPLSYSVITYVTNYAYIANPVSCQTNTAAYREGMEHVTFQRVGYDDILQQLVTPITNYYHLTAVTNGAPVVQTFRRIITQPDILIDAADITAGPAAPPAVPFTARTNPHWNTSLVPPGNGGPGTIMPQAGSAVPLTEVVFTYNIVGPIWENSGPSDFIGGATVFFQTNSVFEFVWGSFDGTTNQPIVYPDTYSIANMEAQLFFQITTSLLPNASVSANGPGNAYNFQLTTLGGSYTADQPLQWTLAANSSGLPPGLTLSSGGLISGSPTTVGTYDFTVQVTDGNGAVVQKDLFIVVTN